MGVQKGAHVSTILPNYPEYLYIWWGILKLGAVHVPIDTNYRGAMLASLINRSDAKIAVVSRGVFLNRFQSVQDKLINIRNIVVAHRLNEPGSTEEEKNLKFAACNLSDLMAYPAEPPKVEVYNYDTASIVWTSGTTGPPKGAIWPHEMFIHSSEVKIKHMGTNRNDIMYNALPMFNPSGQSETCLTALIADAGFVMAERFDPKTFWDDIRKYKATENVSMGGLVALLEKEPASPDDRNHTLRKIYGFPLPIDFQRRFEDRFGVRMMELYGNSESGLTNFRTWDRPKPGSCGPANCGCEVKVFDEQDNECPPNTVGEIVVRPLKPYTIFQGYYKDPEKTLNTMRNLWYHTGDLGRMDEDGYLFFVRRREESIRFRGYLISTTEVERIIGSHPDVLECAVYGVPDEFGQEQDVMVAVRPKPGVTVKCDELLRYAEGELPYFMVPRYVRFVTEFEKTPTMRIIKEGLQKEGVTPDTWDRRKAGFKLSRE